MDRIFKKFGQFIRKRFLGNEAYKFFRKIFGYEAPQPEDMPMPAVYILSLFTAILCGVLIVSNIAALKIWDLRALFPVQFFPIKQWGYYSVPVDGGIWLFPLSYIIGDLIINTYGLRIANRVAVITAALNVAIIFALALLKFLPDYPGVDNSAFNVTQASLGRISFASVAGFLGGQLVNNEGFSKIRKGQQSEDNPKAVRLRAIISSLPAHFVDSLIFEILAFWGRVSAVDFVKQIVFAYLAGVIIEIILSWKLTPVLASKLDCLLKYSDGKRIN